MKTTPQPLLKSLQLMVAALGLGCALLPHTATADIWYWDNNGLATPTSGTWDTVSAQWATNAVFTNAPVVWNGTAAAGFPVGTTNVSALTLTLNSAIDCAGVFNGLNTGAGVTNLVFSGSGSLNLLPGADAFSVGANGVSQYNIIVRVPITGTGQYQHQGSGSAFISGNNTYSGGTVIVAGSGYNIANGNAFGTGTVTNAGAQTIIAVVATDPTGAAFATAPMTVANAWQASGVASTEILVGLAAAPVTFSGPWTLAGSGITTTLDTRTTTWTISGAISGAGNLTKKNTAQLTLSGANTYSGKTTIQNGAISVSSLNKVSGGSASSSLGHPTTAANGTIGLGATTTAGVLIYTGSGETTDRVIDLAGTTGGGTIQNDGSGALTFSSAFTASGAGAKTLTLQGSSTAANTISGAIVDNAAANPTSLTKASTGSWTLTGANTFSGKVTISRGNLTVKSLNKVTGGSASSSLGHPTTAANGTIALGTTTTAGVLIYTGTGETTDRVIDLAGTTGGGTIQNDGTGALTFTSDFTASGSGAKTLTLQGSNTGDNTVAGKIQNGANTTAVAKGGAGTWVLSGANTHTGGTTINSGGGLLKLANASALGTGTFTVNGNSSFDNITGGDLTVANAFALTGGSPTYVGSANNMTISGAVNINNNRTITVSARTLTLGSTITEDATPRNFTKAGNGTLVLAGGSSHSGTTTVSAGTLRIGGAGQLGGGAYAGNVVITGTFDYASSAAQTLSGVISGAGALNKTGSGTLTLTGANTFTGLATVSAGTLDVAAAGSLATGTMVVADLATLKLDATTALGSAVNLFLNAGAPVVNLNFTGTDQISLLSLDGGATFAPKGTYGAIGSGADHESALFTGPGLLSVLWASSSSVVGSVNPATYGDTTTLNASVSGPGPIPTGTVTFKDGATVLGTQPLDASGQAAQPTATLSATTHSITVLYSGDSNYAPSASTVLSFVVNKAPLTVTANDQTKTYGQTLSFGSGSTQFSSSGLQNSETIGTVTLACSGGVATAPVGLSPYSITPSAATGGTFNVNNYTVTYSAGGLTVTPAVLSVTASGMLFYGQDPTNAVYTPFYYPLQGTDTVSAVTGSATFATDAASTNYINSYVGTNYTVFIVDTGTLSAANYTFVVGTNGVMTINPAPVTVTNILASDKTYDTTTAVTVDLSAAGVSAFVNGDEATVSLVTSNGVGSFSNKNAGAGKTVTVSGLFLVGELSTNYSLLPATTTASITPASLTVSATGVDKVYDGTTTATVLLTATPLGTDSVTPAAAAAAFADKNVGTGITVSISGIGLTGTDSGNYTPNATASTTANITPRSLTVTATGVDKVYDGGPGATVTLTDNKVAGDDLTEAYASASFADKAAAPGKPVSVSGITISGGGDAGNYSLANTTASATASITKRPLTVTAVGANKVYDQTVTTSVTLSDDKLAGDLVTETYASASFADKAAATGKPVSVSGISLSGGADAGNYALANTTANTTADITPRPLTVTVTAANKTYDGTANASVTLADDKLTGDAVTESYASALFADKNIGTGKTVTVSGLSLSDGADAGNYALANTTATTTADITAGASLTVVGAQASDKVYDGTTTATLILSNAVLVGVAGTDDVTLITTNAVGAFADKNVGTAKPVTLSGLEIAGADAANYSLMQPATNASITQATLTVTAKGVNKVYDGGTTATVTLASDKVAGDDVTATYADATFADKTVAAGKPVSVSGINLNGADAANYSLASTSANATADITARTLTLTATGVSKVYDGTTAATVTLSDDRVTGDLFTDSYGNAAFASKNVATSIAVNVSDLSISGADAANYSLASTSASTTADITARPLTVTATGVNKVYDGTTAATVTLSDDKVAGDDVSDSYTSASFADANVGTAKAVSVSGISISGTAAGNYSLANTTATTSADIIGAASSTVLTSSLNPATEGSNVTFTATVSSGAGTPTGDVVFLANGVPFSTNTLAAGVATASTASLPVGTHAIVASYATQANWMLSSDTLQQVVNSAVILSQTNAVLSITANGDGTYTLTLLGTPGASYYVVSSGDLSAPSAAWSALTYSTNTAPSPSGQWSVPVSNAAPAFYRSVAVNPAAP